MNKKKVPDDTCSWCKEKKETPEHVLFECNQILEVADVRQKAIETLDGLSLRDALEKDDVALNAAIIELLLKLRKQKVWI